VIHLYVTLFIRRSRIGPVIVNMTVYVIKQYCQTETNAIGESLPFSIEFGGWPGPVSSTDTLTYVVVIVDYLIYSRQLGYSYVGVCCLFVDIHSYPDLPTVSRVSGCTADGNSTINCPTSGGVYVTIEGVKFQDPVTVLISGEACAPIRFHSLTR
jgi:hypothetical protein